jgi:DNA-binding CsgD family transcriptional regulator
MPIKNQHSNFDVLKSEVFSYFNEDHNKIQLVVSEAEQRKETNVLKETMDNERFFFVVNMLTFDIEERCGIQKWLGYSEKEFSFKQYWNQVIHPAKQFLFILARQLYATACQGKIPLNFMGQRFASLVPLKHYKGHYLLAKKTASTFQYDTNSRLIAYVNEFTIIGNYDGEPLQPRMYNFHGQKEPLAEKEIIQKVIASFIGMKIFTINELQVARKTAYNPRITQAQIAKELGLSVHTVNTYYKRFLNKAREFFGKDFLTLLEASIYLRKEGLL